MQILLRQNDANFQDNLHSAECQRNKRLKILYTSITVMIVSNICRLQCTNGVLLGKMVASKSKWI